MWYLRLKFIGGEWILTGQTQDHDVKTRWEDEQQVSVRKTKVDDTHIIERYFGCCLVSYDEEGNIIYDTILG